MNAPTKSTAIKLLIIGLALIVTGTAAYFLFPKKPRSNSGITSQVKVYYIAVGDNGKTGKEIGCGDSLVPVTVNIAPTQAPLRAALEALFADKTQFATSSGLMNSLYQSSLKLDSATVASGTAMVRISGQVALGGVCDDPRFVYQIKNTVAQFPSVHDAVILLNDKLLETYFSEKY